MPDRLSAEDFLAAITAADYYNFTINPSQELEVSVGNIVDDVMVKAAYVGPDPISTGYVAYMQFLGQLEQITGLQTFVRDYLQDRLR